MHSTLIALAALLLAVDSDADRLCRHAISAFAMRVPLMRFMLSLSVAISKGAAGC